jgi:riboflavin synthase
MFTGIVQSTAPIKSLDFKDGILSYSLEFEPSMLNGLAIGTSVSIDGCCQTLVKADSSLVYFQAIPETLRRTSMGDYRIGQKVNIERSAHFGDEIGGHILSGHILGKASLHKIERPSASTAIFHLKCPSEWMAYIFEKGFIALDGASLTVVDVFQDGLFTVHLIPETLSRTTFGNKNEGDFFNVEIDSFTQSIVQTVERVLASRR